LQSAAVAVRLFHGGEQMKRMFITAGLACVLAAPGFAFAQTAAGSAAQANPSEAAKFQAKKPTGTATTQGTGQSGQSATAQSGGPAAIDKRFVMAAAAGGLAEVELGRLAADKASNADVKQFGQRMVDDHGKANDELKSLASQKNITLPADLDAKEKATRDRLSKLSGDAFDRAYMREMVADHNKDVAEFQHASKMAKDSDVKAWAAKTLPTLEEHQKMAKEIHAKVAGAPAKGTAKPKTAPEKK
jgi:putative membrane protein